MKAELEKLKPTLPVEGDFPIINVTNSLGRSLTIYKDKWNDNQIFKVDGKFYDKGIGITMSNGDTRYAKLINHDLKYTKFTGYFAIDEMSKNAAADSFKVTVTTGTASGTILYENTIKKSDGLVKFDIDITGVSEPRMTFSCDGYDTLYITMINPAFK